MSSNPQRINWMISKRINQVNARKLNLNCLSPPNLYHIIFHLCILKEHGEYDHSGPILTTNGFWSYPFKILIPIHVFLCFCFLQINNFVPRSFGSAFPYSHMKSTLLHRIHMLIQMPVLPPPGKANITALMMSLKFRFC